MEGNCNGSNSRRMGLGENSSGSGLCPMMMMPFVTTCFHHNNPNPNPNPNHLNLPTNTNTNTSVFHPVLCSTYYNNIYNSSGTSSSSSSMLEENHNNNSNSNSNSNTGYYSMEIDHNNNGSSSSSSSAVKAKIMAHPHYHRLLAAYLNCQKVGAPAEVVARLEEACAASAVRMGGGGGCIGEDPALDQFMEAYCEMLIKYEQELSKPFNEAMLFLQTIHSQFNSLAVSPSHFGSDRNGSSEEEADLRKNAIDPQAEEGELKGQLLRKYSGYLGSLKQEFMKKRKKGKLPKEARQQLLEWWSRHYKWPYPSESQKVALAEATGLDQKQINNWFINQRKRHWKPSEDMQFVVVDPSSPHPHYYMDNLLLPNPFPPIHLSHHTML